MIMVKKEATQLKVMFYRCYQLYTYKKNISEGYQNGTLLKSICKINTEGTHQVTRLNYTHSCVFLVYKVMTLEWRREVSRVDLLLHADS